MKKKSAVLLAAAVVVGAAIGFYQHRPSAAKAAQPGAALSAEVASPGVTASCPAAVQTSDPFALPTNQTATVRGTKPYVLQSEVKFQKSLRVAAESLGARTIGVLSPMELLIEADAATCRRLKADSRFSDLVEYLPMRKVEERLVAALESGAKEVEASVVSLAREDRARVIACVQAGGGEILKGCLNEGDLIRARLSPDLVMTLAERGDVRWMELFDRPQLMNNVAVNPEAMNVRPVWDDVYGLSGTGQVVSTSDSGIDTGDPETLHEDLRDRVIDMKAAEGCDMFDSNGHGTHTAGSIVGNGTKSDGEIRGSAWGAKLHVWFCGKDGGRGIYTPPTCDELFRGSEDGTEWADAFIHSASWGSDTAGAYSTECNAFDKYLWEHPDFLPVVSAGNAGPGGKTIGSPAASKNVLAVGATLNLSKGDPSSTASFSSRGPCQDGRIKPDIAAPGDSVTSTRSSKTAGTGDYTSMSGTSMSCPLTAGAVALVREWLCKRSEYDESNPPTAAMMKAVITGGAKGAPVPNKDQGWGRVDLAETLYPTDRAVRLIDRIPFSEGDEFYYVVETTNAAPLDVQLAWVDFPGMAGSGSKTLVNDLDLTVEPLYGSDGAVMFGNGGTSEDVLNNLESVHMDEAPTNRYLITVSCNTILHDHTEGGAAALYIRGAFDPTLELEKETEGRVRIKGRTDLYMSLDSALRAAGDNDTVEVLAPTRLKIRRTVARNLTICATNDDPSASAVAFMPGAELAVSNDVTLCVSNLVFANGGARTVDVLPNGVLKVMSQADLGEIRLADAKNLLVAGPLTSAIVVDAPFAPTNGVVFGRCSSASVGESATYLFNKYDEESVAEFVSDGLLRWFAHPEVPLDAAIVRLEPEEGENVGYRSLDVLLKYHPAPTGAVAVVKSGVLTNRLAKVDYDLFLYGAGGNVVLTPSSTARLVVVGDGSLVVSNLTFDGYSGTSLFTVDSAAARLRLEDSGILNAVSETTEHSPAVTVLKGRADLVRTLVSGCRAENDDMDAGCGGGAYVASGARLSLEGSTITDCWATFFGGGVYLAENATNAIRGATVVRDNRAGQNNDADDIYRVSSESVLIVSGVLCGGRRSIGVKSGDEEGVEPGYAAAVNALAPSASRSETNACARAFFCDGVDSLMAVAKGDEFVWQEGVPPTGSEEDGGEPVVVSNRVTGTVLYYGDIGDAFNDLSGDSDVLLRPSTGDEQIGFTNNLQVAYDVTLMTAPSVVENGRIWHLDRMGNCSIIVNNGSSLTLANVVVSGCKLTDYDPQSREGIPDIVTNSVPLILANGGTLTLSKGADVCFAFGTDSRAAVAVTVRNGGTFTMRDGARIHSSVNVYDDDPNERVNDGYGGGLLLDSDSVAYLVGGVVSNCSARGAGGVFAGSRSTVHVSGGVLIAGNFRSAEIVRTVSAPANDLVVSDDSALFLDGILTGNVGYTEGDAADTNVFGKVVVPLTQEIADSATNFWHNLTRAQGLVATNGTEALLVWVTAVKTEAGGRRYYEDKNGNRYEVVTTGGGFVPTPGPSPEPEVKPQPIAFKSITRFSETQWTLVVTNAVQWCNYRLFATNTLEGGFVLTNSEGQLIVEPVTNFQWKLPDREIELIMPADGSQRFWRAEGLPGTQPAP